MNAFEELMWRGAVFDSTEGADALLGKEMVTVYCGFDPSGPSLHIGHLVPLMGLVRLQRFGHSPIALVGGGTGMIGDPGGRDSERPLLSVEQIDYNVERIRGQLEPFLEFKDVSNPARLVNNADWLRTTYAIDFMREVGKHFTVNYMLAKESVRTRMARDEGISYTEFSYMLLQAYDFVQLHDQFGCQMQIGGSDQWGNILAGVDLVRRTRGAKGARAQALVYPLITTATGEKFGKSVGGAPTLDPAVTSPYRMYQFFVNTDDRDVISYLKLFTLLDADQISEQATEVEADPGARQAQKLLASEVTRLVHGESGLAAASAATRVLFGGEIASVSVSQLKEIFADVPSSEIPRNALEGDGISLTRLMADAGVSKSAGEARRLVQQGGISVNNQKATDHAAVITLSDLIDGQLLLIRRGARNYHLIHMVG